MRSDATMLPFAAAADAVASTTKKLEKIRLVSALFKSLPLDDAARAAVFLAGQPFPRRDERILGVGGTQLSTLVAEVAGTPREKLGHDYRQHGDLGDMAEQLLNDTQQGSGPHKKGISLTEVASTFDQLAALRAQDQKLATLRAIFSRATPAEAKYIIKIITGDLRIGLKESLVEEAIAKAFDRRPDDVRHANMLTGDIAETLHLAAADMLASAAIKLFHPVGFMLASPVDTAAETFGDSPAPMYVEQKYDGIRAQVHKSADGVRIFSRTLDQITEFPELITAISSLPGELILDGEILAWHGDSPLPFTDLQKRLGRKQLDLWLAHDIPVRFIAFDILYRDGKLLLDLPLSKRRPQLKQVFAGVSEKSMGLGQVEEASSAEGVERAFEGSLAAGHEGIVAKSPDSPYMPGRRGRFWFKLKRPFATLDAVVTAVEYGHGKRHKVLSDYTFAVRDGQRLLNIGKAYSGLTDEEILEHTRYFLDHTVEDQGFRRTVEPTVVIEVAFNNIQRSNRHASGYALRFPRILRFRPDKSTKEIDTIDRVAELYAKQTTLPRHARSQP